MITEAILELLRKRAFVSIATCDKKGAPHAAPKLLLKIRRPFIYLIDYTIAKTVENLKENPRASLSIMDLDNLEGYRLNGSVELIEHGEEHRAIFKELDKRLIELSAKRLIEGVRSGKKSAHFELEIPEKFVVIKIEMEESVKIGPRGDFWKEKGQ